MIISWNTNCRHKGDNMNTKQIAQLKEDNRQIAESFKYLDGMLLVKDYDTANIVSNKITEMHNIIIRLTSPKNKRHVGFLLNQMTFANMQIDGYESKEGK